MILAPAWPGAEATIVRDITAQDRSKGVATKGHCVRLDVNGTKFDCNFALTAHNATRSETQDFTMLFRCSPFTMVRNFSCVIIKKTRIY